MEPSPQVIVRAEGSRLTVAVGGTWRMPAPWPKESEDALREITAPGVEELALQARDLGAWDTSLLAFLVQLARLAEKRHVSLDRSGLPDGLQRLMNLAFAVKSKDGATRRNENHSLLYSVGDSVLGLYPKILDFLSFIGDVLLSLWRLFLGRAAMRNQDFVAAMQESGLRALPIISVTSLLFGLILAFVGAVQLRQFGAQIYVAGLVGIGMLRVMGAIMVGVVMSGRVGAAYAAMIGTMQVNEEVDALSTLGISPLDFLVLPRILALALMVPLLTVYADLMGILGGYLVGVTMLGLNPLEYLNATVRMVPFRHMLIGLAYAAVFGIVIALAGCYQGMRCGRSALAVGQATTTAVVHSIVGIIVTTAIITLMCNVLGI